MRKLLTVVLVLALIVAGLGLVLRYAKQARPFAAGTESASRLLPGPYRVESYDKQFVDQSRRSQAYRDFEGSAERVLDATVWYPELDAAEPLPLIVYSHGFTSTRMGGAYLAEHLASYGYVVVAADFPLTNMQAPAGPWVRDVVNQPGDVSFLIDSLIASSSEPEHVLAGLVDAQRIGVTGISLGGMTSTLAAYHPVLGDRRITAALSIAGPTAQLAGAFFRHRDPIPFLMLAGDIDALVPFKSNALPVLENIPDSQLVTIVNASHTGFAGPSASLRFMSNPDALGCFMVQRSVEDDNPDDIWIDELGTPEQGINYDAANELCLVDPLPPAMNPLRQQMITAVVVRAFFDGAFAADEKRRRNAKAFLSETLPRELAEVRVAQSDAP